MTKKINPTQLLNMKNLENWKEELRQEWRNTHTCANDNRSEAEHYVDFLENKVLAQTTEMIEKLEELKDIVELANEDSPTFHLGVRHVIKDLKASLSPSSSNH